MPSEYEKFYKILDLDEGASKEEIKKSFSIDDNSSYSEKYEKGSLFSLIRFFSSIAITFLALMVLLLFFLYQYA